MRPALRRARREVSTAFSRRGLVAEHGSSSLLPRMIGLHRAFDLLVSARKFDADEAYELGLLNGIPEPDQLLDDVYAYARELATYTPHRRGGDQAPTAAPPGGRLGRRAARDLRMLQAALRRPDVAEGSAAFVEKREPQFRC